ncbi:MAG: hypothetical protein HQ561_10335 [Desulfobacteraceae bacterium]|nr:hypothetical protein [Desulfobacteraceae bacterium]
MTVTMIPVGLLKSYCKDILSTDEKVIVDGKEGKTLGAVCYELGIPGNLISLFVVNGRRESKNYVLQPDDEVRCVSLLGGG